MKRSEMNQHYHARLEFSKLYDCVSCTQEDPEDPESESTEEYFSHHGCDVCRNLPGGGAGMVSDVTYLARTDIDKGVFDNPYEGSLCSGCLCSLVNGDNSDLDYSTTEEDCPSVSR